MFNRINIKLLLRQDSLLQLLLFRRLLEASGLLYCSRLIVRARPLVFQDRFQAKQD